MRVENHRPSYHIDSRINLLSADDHRYRGRKHLLSISKYFIYLLVIMAVGFIVFSYQVIFTDNSVSDIFSGKINILKQLSTLAGDSNRLQGENDDRINILLLGMGGAGHEGPYLTDTIILASIKPSLKKIALFNIPRDLLVDIPGFGQNKINNVNAYGEQKNSGAGALLVKEVLNKTFDLPVHYYIRVDFNGFEKIIDDLGGIKINVKRGFTDYQYPTEDFKYQIISFEPGWQTMDGETALKFVRSRHGNNGEGSDFARSNRQQQLLTAFKKRFLSFYFLLNPRKINKTIENLSGHLKTDFEPWEIVRLAKFIQDVEQENIITTVFDDSPNGLLYPANINGAYVLLPKGDEFSQIQFLVRNIFRGQEIISEKKIVSVDILNGTEISGLASRNAEELKLVGLRVMKIANAPEQNFTKTQIYSISSRDLAEETTLLEKKYKISAQISNFPEWVKLLAGPDIDFMIVLGQDANQQ